jgi:hypothetical protein
MFDGLEGLQEVVQRSGSDFLLLRKFVLIVLGNLSLEVLIFVLQVLHLLRQFIQLKLELLVFGSL